MAKTKNPNMARDKECYEKNIAEYKFKKGDPRTIECAKKGAAASIAIRKDRKSMSDDAKTLLNIAIKKGEIIDVENLDNMQQAAKTNLTAQQGVILGMIQRALDGDVKAAVFLRDTIGENPVLKARVDGEAELKVKTSMLEQTLMQLRGGDDSEDDN